MKLKLYKELWQSRFQKMLELERGAVRDYEELLAESRAKFKKAALEAHLEHLIADEKKHARLVEELLEILKRQPE
ncbi:MAG TPA: hypothetical protein VL404_09950 [Candidatus Eisenbacteria bacterium]|jgi:rubrerythrin|nr:hypothetical protein [Candidatus Eisenbacteria bacterium]